MKRLVYAPNIQAFIKTATGVIDISPYLVSGTVNRKVNQVSGAQLTLRNPANDQGKMLFTADPHNSSGAGAMFHPMDPIIIVMQRLAAHPVQVFTGYLDKSPYIQLYPGLCTVEASCTLKRLLYTQWDAALPFVKNFLELYGWVLTSETGIANPTAEANKLKTQAGQLKGQFNDGSIGALLFAVLTQIGGWDSSNIAIEALPPVIFQIVQDLYNSISKEAQEGSDLFKGLITQILGAAGQGSGTSGTAASTSNINGLQPGQAWKITTSDETNDGTNGGPGCDGTPSVQIVGYSELSTHLNYDYAALGNLPCNTQMIIANPANGKSTVQKKQDNGNGSPGNLPVMGLYPATRAALGLDNSGSHEVIIQRADGKPLKPVRGTPINITGSSTTSTKSSPPAQIPGKHGLAPASDIFSPTVQTNVSRAGTSPGGKSGTPSATPPNSSGTYSQPLPGISRADLARTDEGVDYFGKDGEPILAIGNCKVVTFISFDGAGVVYQLTDGDHAGMQIYVAEGIRFPSNVTVGATIQGGNPIALFNQSNSPCGTPCIETGFWENGHPYKNTDAQDGQPYSTASGRDGRPTVGGWEFTNFLNSIGQATLQKAPPGFGGGSTSGGGATSGSSTSGNTIADAFSTFINLPSIFDSAEALAFTGKRSFIADQPLFPFIEQLCQASLRNFMSMPNGNFFAFFPDYFGLFGRKYYWELHDIEIIDGRIDLTDDPLVTNVAVAGDVTQYHGTIDVFDLILTSGIFDIFDAFATNYIAGPDSLLTVSPQTSTNNKKASKAAAAASKQKALAFLRRYGARPYVEEAPMIRSPIFELFLAFQKFMLLWSKQFQTTFELTFMPEIFPGGLIGLPEHGLQLYIEEVQHSFDYEQGFTTTVAVSSPSAIASDSNPTTRHGLAGPTLAAVK